MGIGAVATIVGCAVACAAALRLRACVWASTHLVGDRCSCSCRSPPPGDVRATRTCTDGDDDDAPPAVAAAAGAGGGVPGRDGGGPADRPSRGPGLASAESAALLAAVLGVPPAVLLPPVPARSFFCSPCRGVPYMYVTVTCCWEACCVG